MNPQTSRVDIKIGGQVVDRDIEFNLSHMQGLTVLKKVYISSENRYYNVDFISYNTSKRCFEICLRE